MNFQMFWLDLEKTEEPEIKMPTSTGSLKKQESSKKHHLLLLDNKKLWKILKEMGIPDSRETCMQVKKQQLEPDMEQQTGSKLGKECVKAIYGHPAYLTYLQST